MQEMQVWSLDQEDPLEEEMTTHSSIHIWESHGQKSLVGYSSWSCKESDTTEQLGKMMLEMTDEEEMVFLETL